MHCVGEFWNLIQGKFHISKGNAGGGGGGGVGGDSAGGDHILTLQTCTLILQVCQFHYLI